MNFARSHEPYEFDALAVYNAETARGIVHTPEWVERMRLEKERFDAQQVWLVQHTGRPGRA